MRFHLWVRRLTQTNNDAYIGDRCQLPQVWDAAIRAALASLAEELPAILRDKDNTRRHDKIENLIGSLLSTNTRGLEPSQIITPDEVNRLVQCLRQTPDPVKLRLLAHDLKTRTFTDAEVFGQTSPTSESGTETPSSS